MKRKVNEFISRVKHRRVSDLGDAILVMSVIFVPFFFIVAGFAIDLSKAAYVKQQYQTMAQEAANDAARQINEKGSIKESAVDNAVYNYTQRRFEDDDSNKEHFSETKELMDKEYNSDRCAKIYHEGKEYDAPLMFITISGGRGQNDTVPPVRYMSSNGLWAYPVVSDVDTGYSDSNIYRKIELTVYDSSPNLIMGMFGRGCQYTKSVVNAVQFGSNEDANDWSGSLSPQVDIPEWVKSDLPEIYRDHEIANCTFTGNTITWGYDGGRPLEGALGIVGQTLTPISGPTGTPFIIPDEYEAFAGYGKKASGQAFIVYCKRPPLFVKPAWMPENWIKGTPANCKREENGDITWNYATDGTLYLLRMWNNASQEWINSTDPAFLTYLKTPFPGAGIDPNITRIVANGTTVEGYEYTIACNI